MMNRIIMIGATAFVASAGALFLQTDQAAAQTTTEQTATEQTQAADTTEAMTDTATESAPQAMPNDAGIYEMTLGPADAKVTVMEYASFTCPHCANFHKDTFKQLKANYIDTGKVQFIYRDVYFDRPGLWAAMVARCDGPTRFFGIVDMLFSQQREWVSGSDPVAIADNLRKIGKVAGMSDEKLEACLTDADKAKALFEWFEANAEADGITSTPSLVINGEAHGNMSYADLSEIIEKELAE